MFVNLLLNLGFATIFMGDLPFRFPPTFPPCVLILGQEPTAQVRFANAWYTSTWSEDGTSRVYKLSHSQQPGLGTIVYSGKHMVTAMAVANDGLLIAFKAAGIYHHPKGLRIGCSDEENSIISKSKYHVLSIEPQGDGHKIQYTFLIGKKKVVYIGDSTTLGKRTPN